MTTEPRDSQVALGSAPWFPALGRMLCRLGIHAWTYWEWGEVGHDCKRCGERGSA